jgi:hypothetical protein
MGAGNSLAYPRPPPCLLCRLQNANAAPITKNTPATTAIAMPAFAPAESPLEE